jgi:hypothetical protein
MGRSNPSYEPLLIAKWKEMSTNIEIKTTIDLALSTTKILLAEVDLNKAERIKSSIDIEFQNRMKVVKSYEEILQSITEEKPRLLILGRIDKFNYFDTCKGCRQIWEDLPIFLLSRQEVISESFLKLAKSRGLTDIISLDPIKLHQLFKTLDKSSSANSVQRVIVAEVPPIQNRSITGITGRSMLECLGEIVIISNNYFGPLAQGNYWRKAHANTIDLFPSILSWSADHFSKISCNDNILDAELMPEDIQGLRIWVQFFISECERIIIDFETILVDSDISPLAKDLLTKL